MTLVCDNCHETGKGRYKTFWMEGRKGKKKLVTWCYECLGVSAVNNRTDDKTFEHISTPFWVHAGLKPKPREKAQLEYMKKKGMTWGDMRKARYSGMPKTNAGVKAFEKHIDKYGRRNAPDVSFKKAGN